MCVATRLYILGFNEVHVVKLHKLLIEVIVNQ